MRTDFFTDLKCLYLGDIEVLDIIIQTLAMISEENIIVGI